MSSFGNELSLIRKKHEYTQYRLAKEINLSRSHVLRLENGERNPNLEFVEKVATVFSLNNYEITKLLLLANLEINISNTYEDFKLCYKLSLELKNKGVLDKAQKLIELGISKFENIIELNALLANLKLIQNQYDDAIALNQEIIKNFETLSEKSKKQLGITKAEVIHNLGYVYFEKGLSNNSLRELEIIASWENKNNSKTVEDLRVKILADFNIAIEKFEIAYQLEKNNVTIIDQLARIFFHKADLSYGDERVDLFKKSIDFYDQVISKEDKNFERHKKEEASIFLALALGKIFELKEASRIINTIINYKPQYYLGYYAKACIYAINGKDNLENITISYEALNKAISLEGYLKEQIKLEVDLYNLRYDKVFYSKFNDLC